MSLSQSSNSSKGAPVLVVGATGHLGGEIVTQLRASGRTVRALVRSTSDLGRVEYLKRLGCHCVVGDLRDAVSIGTACRDVSAVVSTATALTSRLEGESLESIDLQGQLGLVAEAERCGAGRFVFVSFPAVPGHFSFQEAKRAVEGRLCDSSLSFTIIQAAPFAEVWLSPQLGFDPLNGSARILGSGKQPTSWISLVDVARFAAAATSDSIFNRRIFALGGPEALSYEDVLRLFSQEGVTAVAAQYVSVAELEASCVAAGHVRQLALAALALSTARGQVISTDDVRTSGLKSPRGMRDYVAELVAKKRGGDCASRVRKE